MGVVGDDQPDAREGQAGRSWVAERFVVPKKPGNAGGGKGTGGAQGRVHRFVRGKVGPFPARWEEEFGEWQENHRLFQVRNYQNGPMRRWEWDCELVAEGEGCRLIVTGLAEPAGLLGFMGTHAGVFDAESGKAAAAIERIIGESEGSALVPGWSIEDLAEPASR